MANEKRLIDANAFRNNIRAIIEDRKKAGMPYTQLKIVDIVVQNCPTVEAVEVVHGRWNEPYRLYVTCSNCGTGYVKYEFIERANYCPNCGAKMDGDGNG